MIKMNYLNEEVMIIIYFEILVIFIFFLMVYSIKFLFDVGYYFIINNCNKNCRYVNKIELYYKVRVYC